MHHKQQSRALFNPRKVVIQSPNISCNTLLLDERKVRMGPGRSGDERENGVCELSNMSEIPYFHPSSFLFLKTDAFL